MNNIKIKSNLSSINVKLADEKENESKIILEDNIDDYHSFHFDNLKYTHFSLSVFDSIISKIYPGDFDLELEIEEDNNVRFFTSNFGKIITHTLKDEINLSKLTKRKKVYIYLPKNYDKHKKCEVLLSFDGQNAFDSKTGYTSKNDPYGGVNLDYLISQYTDYTKRNIIVVGIDNASPLREIELTMSERTYGKYSDSLGRDVLKDDGQLEHFEKFIDNTLLPFLKREYNADLDKIHLYGSSCGGSAAFYLGMNNFKRYKSILCFSPAFALFDDVCNIKFINNLNFKDENLPKLFIYNGNNDELERDLYTHTLIVDKLLNEKNYDKKKLSTLYVQDFPHNEISWRNVLPKAISFCLND